MAEHDAGAGLEFGSARRAGRDEAAYQQDRLALYLAFQTSLLDALQRRVAHLERTGREVWDARLLHERQHEHWRREASNLSGLLDEARRWNEQLVRRRDELDAAIAEQFATFQAQLTKMDSELSEVRQRAQVWKRQLLFRVLRRLKLLRDLPL